MYSPSFPINLKRCDFLLQFPANIMLLNEGGGGQDVRSAAGSYSPVVTCIIRGIKGSEKLWETVLFLLRNHN